MSNDVISTQTQLPAISQDVADLLKQAAEAQASNERSGIPFLSVKGKKFADGDEVLGTAMSVVILADVFDHAYYDRPYDPKAEDVFPPVCFSISNPGSNADMVPHEDAPEPQHITCDGCPMDEFGSARQGAGKACRNGRRLLIAPFIDGKVDFGNLAIVNISPTALKGFSKYVKNVSSVKKLPLWAVGTELSFDDEQSYPVVLASFIDNLSGADSEIIAQRLPEFIEAVSVPYNVEGYEPYEPAAAAASTAKKSKMS